MLNFVKSRTAGKNLSLLFVVFLFTQFNLFAQAPTVEWTQWYDMFPFKWWRLRASIVHQTQEGNFIIGGNCQIQYHNCFIILTDMDGDTILTRLYEGKNFTTFQPTFDGGYVIFGVIGSLNLFKVDSDFEIQWDKEYCDSLDWTNRNWMEQTTDSGFILLGSDHKWNPDRMDFHLLKTDSFGEVIWHKTFYWQDEFLEVYNVMQTNDGGFIVSGLTNTGSDYENFLLRLNENGDSLWTKFYDLFPWGIHVLPTSDGGFLITGGNLYLIKTDGQGEITWIKQFPGGSGIMSIEYSDGGYVTCAGGYLVKNSEQGDSLWSMNSDEGIFIDIKETADNGLIVVGGKGGWFEPIELSLSKLTFEPNEINDLSQDIPGKFSLSHNYPNPFNPSTKIQYSIPKTSKVVIKVFDLLGNEIETLVNEEKRTGTYELTWYAEGLPSGVYFYQLKSGKFIETKKMILMK